MKKYLDQGEEMLEAADKLIESGIFKELKYKERVRKPKSKVCYLYLSHLYLLASIKYLFLAQYADDKKEQQFRLDRMFFPAWFALIGSVGSILLFIGEVSLGNMRSRRCGNHTSAGGGIAI